MGRFRERPIDPPEPLCPKCRKIWWPDGSDYACPECGATIEKPECGSCGWSGDWKDGVAKCPHCGFDGSRDDCVVCNRSIPPSSSNYGYSICESCEEKSHRERYNDEHEMWEDKEIEYYENLDRATENECYAIEQGAKTEEDINGLFGGDAS